MTLAEFKRIVRRNKWKVIIIPIVTAVSVYFFTSRLLEKKYTSDTTIFSGISSSYKIAGDNNAIDNQTYAANALGDFVSILNSRGVKEEVAIRLLAHDLMLDKPDPKVLNKDDFEALQKTITKAERNKLVAPTLDSTIANVRAAYHADHDNDIYKLINAPKGGTIWSIDALSKIQAGQIGTSELVQMQYSTSDPAICYETLVLTNRVFMAKHDSLFSTQAKSVIGYFDTITNHAFDKLHVAEQKLLDFSKQNNIADYEQEINISTESKTASLQKLNDLQGQYAGAVASLKTIEQSLKNAGVSNLESEDIIQQKERLGELTKQLTEQQLYGSRNNKARIAALQQSITEQSANITTATDKLYNSTHSTEGLPIASLLDEYLKDEVLVAQLKSQIEETNGQNSLINEQYSRLVPVGIELRSLTRDVDLAEKDYLAEAEGLRQSKLTQENSLLAASHIKILDPPNFPAEPLNLAPVLAIAGYIAALILVFGALIAAEMLDTSLKSPGNAEKVTHFKVLGVFPLLKNDGSKANLLADKIAQDEMARQLLLRFYQNDGAKLPFVVGILSSFTGEGKSVIATSLAENLNSFGIKTMALIPSDQNNAQIARIPTGYNLNGSQVSYAPPMGLTKNTVADVTGTRFYDYSVILVEFPALLEKSYPVSLIKNLDFILLTVKADRSWLKPDASIYDNISKVTNAPIEIVLNGVSREFQEDFIGTPVSG
jgi:capsular polysaccharide biosynthesis protein